MVKKFINHYFYITIVLIILTILFTYPIAFNMKTSFYGYPGDIYGTIWFLWWFKYSIFDLKVSPVYSSFFGAPDGVYMPISIPAVGLQSLPFTIVFGEVFSFNILILLSFVLSGIGMYALSYYLIKNKYASLVSGIIFAFSPYHIAHSMDHLVLAQIQWIPFCLLYMFKLDKERTYKNAVIFGIFFTILIFSNAYYTLFIVISILIYTLYKIYVFKNLGELFNRKNLKIVAIISSIVGGSSLMVYFIFIKPALFSIQEFLPTRDINELIIYSAKPWDFFLPPIYHPVFGQYVQKFVLSHLYGSNPIEQVLYIGYVPLALSIYAIFKFLKNKRTEEYNIVILFTLFGFVALSFMPPAYLQIYGLKIPSSLSYFLYQIIQSFRVMTRFDVMVMVSVAILSGISIKYLLQEKIKKGQLIFLSFVILIILFEFAPIPSNISQIKRPEQNFPFSQLEYEYHTTKIDIPDEYNWLANQKGDFVIIEYPLVFESSKEEIIHYRYKFYQRIHKKRLINGGPMGIMGDLSDIYKNSPESKLKKMGVKYAIVHTDLTGKYINISGFALVKKFNDTLILEPYD